MLYIHNAHQPISIRLLVTCYEPIIDYENPTDSHHYRGGHLGYLNETIVAILNLCSTGKPPIKFQLNVTLSLGGDVV